MPQTLTIDEDKATTIKPQATDIDSDTLTYSVVNQPQYGTYKNNIYTPNKNYFGSDSFTIKANDGKVDSNIVTITLTIKPTNDKPIANSQTITIDQDTNTTIKLTATDIDDDNLTYTITKQPQHGTLKNNIYTPNKNFTGTDTITFKANDGKSDSNEATITIKVKLDNKPEVINGYTLPPEPDEALNNSTLLGIDSNNNGVRDDVERWIIKHYAKDPKYPKTKTAIAMQYAWATQKILENPTVSSNKYLDDVIDCQYYWLDSKTDGLSGFEYGKFSNKHSVLKGSKLDDKFFNTRKRIETYFEFNSVLSGNIFNGRKESINNCQINIDMLGE
jgi:VCBS repeat-containing protein